MLTAQAIKRKKVDLALLLVAGLWGGSYLAAKVLTEHAPVIAVLAIRFSITTLVLVPIWALRNGNPLNLLRDQPLLLRDELRDPANRATLLSRLLIG